METINFSAISIKTIKEVSEFCNEFTFFDQFNADQVRGIVMFS